MFTTIAQESRRLDDLPDEELVLFYQQTGLQVPKGLLFARHWWAVCQRIGHAAHEQGLSVEDTEDAQQVGVMWLVEAIETYDASGLRHSSGSGFRTYANLVVTQRCKDFVRAIRRSERRVDHATSAEDALDSFPTRVRAVAGHRGIGDVAAEPRDEPMWEEAWARVNEVLATMDQETQTLWQHLGSKRTLREIATELSIPYDALRSRRRRLLTRLARAIRQPLDP